MGTSTPGTDMAPNGSQVVLPPGVTVGVGRETSQLNGAGQVVQGMLYPITLGGGTTTSVFIPYSVGGNVAQIQALFDARISAVQVIPGQG